LVLLLACCGAALAIFLGSKMGLYEPGQNIGLLAAMGGAIVILIAYRIITKL
jgi:uncharacterized membrane protein YeaQ/YmgE (transglycosylase-associated protein family)